MFRIFENPKNKNKPSFMRTNALTGDAFLRSTQQQHNNLFDLNAVANPNFTSDEYKLKISKKSIYINFYRKDYIPENKTARPIPGWKLHVNIKLSDLNKAWEVIIPILQEHKINVFKYTKPTAANSWQKGLTDLSKLAWIKYLSQKELTIYQQHNKNNTTDFWHSLISRIEQTLFDNNITEGTLPSANRPIQGSNYFSYRNDAHPEDSNKYISDKQAEKWAQSHKACEAYNPSNNPDDPFKNIKLNQHQINPLHKR